MVLEVTTELEEPIEGEEPKSSGRKLICKLGCSQSFSNGIDRRNHHAIKHTQAYLDNTVEGANGNRVEKRSRNQPPAEQPKGEVPLSDTGAPMIGGVNMGAVSELTRKFAQALEDTAPGITPGKMRQIILGFDQASYTMGGDPFKMGNFLTTCGLSPQQIEFLKMVMLGADPGQPQNTNPWGMPNNGAPQAMTWDQRTGQMVQTPIIMMGGNNGQASPQGYNGPPMIYMQPNGTAGDGLSKKDLEEVFEKLADKLKPAEPTTAAGPPMRRIQKVLTDDHGNAVTDAAGKFLTGWVEEPISTQNDTIHMLKEIGVLGGKEPPLPPSAVEIAEAVQGVVAQLVPENTGPSPEIVEMRDELRESRKDFTEYMHRTEVKDAQQVAADDAVAKTMLTVQPFLDELKDMRSQTGLTDQQAELQHQERLSSNILSAIQGGFTGIRQDLQPFAMQGMVSSLKAAGLEDNTIGDILQRMTINPAAGGAAAADDRKAQTMRDWVKS